MSKKIFPLEGWKNYDDAMAAAKEALIAGKFIIYPTDTLYGFGANATDEKAVAKVVAAKGRENAKPISILVSDLEMMRRYAELPDDIAITLQQLLPGPFTIILNAKPGLPAPIVSDGKIGIRIPHHVFITTVVRQLQFPITATSANLSGEKGPTRLEAVPEKLRKAAAALIDGGPTRWGEGSTVIDFTLKKPAILRRGANCELAEEIVGAQ